MTDSGSDSRVITLELTEKIKQEQIVTLYEYNLKTGRLVLQLNHKYDKRIIASPLKSEWPKTILTLKKQLERNGVKPEHVTMLTDVADNNAESILRKSVEKDDEPTDGKQKKKGKREFIAYKYSNLKKGDLHEAIILSDKPIFLKHDSEGAEPIKLVEVIEEATRVIRPPSPENYPYIPYEFKNIEEVLSYLNRARKETIDSLYEKSKKIVWDYCDHEKHKQNLLAIDVTWTYHQDKFPTTHYDIVLGSPGSGKSSYGETFGAMAYRPIILTDPNAASIIRILGMLEPGQCTIISDETGAIEQKTDVMAILKNGYSIRGRKPKVNDYTREPEYYFTYGFKMLIAEKMPNLRNAKGVRDRSFDFTVFKGRPKYDIKETLEPQGNSVRQKRLDELNDFRKLMLLYRLLHFKDPIEDIDVGVEGRDKELSKPIIQLFYGTRAQNEVEETLQYWLKQRNEKKDVTLEPALHPIVTRLVKEKGNEIYVKEVWEVLINKLPGLYDPKRPNEFQSEDYGNIYRNTISSILEGVFGGEPKHHELGNSYIFDLDNLKRVGRSYNITTSIQTKLVDYSPEDPEGAEDIREEPGDNKRDNNYGKVDVKETKNCSSPSVEPSEPSEPSATTNESYFRSRLERLVEKNGGIFKGNELQDLLVGSPAWTETTLMIKNALESGEIEAVEGEYDTYRIVK